MRQYENILKKLNQQLDEGRITNAMTAAAVAGAIGVGGAMFNARNDPDRTSEQGPAQTSSQVQNPANPTISTVGKTRIKNFEGLRTHPYDDRTGDDIREWNKKATIGYGHLIPESEWETYKDGISSQQADELFERDVQRFVAGVENAIKPALQQNQLDALVSLAFNIGMPRFKSSSLVKLFNGLPGSEYSDKRSAWLAWNQADGKPNKGLIKRRNAEWKAFEEPI